LARLVLSRASGIATAKTRRLLSRWGCWPVADRSRSAADDAEGSPWSEKVDHDHRCRSIHRHPRGIRLEDAAGVDSGIAAALAHDGPVPLDAVVNWTGLAMSASVTLEMTNGFTLFMLMARIRGRVDELIDLARLNLWH
jgi:NAD(P)-dependent dehydrogenase (short-subunit alcohol dehydrogenase family)